MFRPVKMFALKVLISAQHLDKSLQLLARLGVLHLERLWDSEQYFTGRDLEIEKYSISEKLELVVSLLQTRQATSEFEASIDNQVLDQIEKKVKDSQQKRQQLDQHISTLREDLVYLKDFPLQQIELSKLHQVTHLAFKLGYIEHSALSKLKSKFSLSVGEQQRSGKSLVLISVPSSRTNELNETLSGLPWEEINIRPSFKLSAQKERLELEHEIDRLLVEKDKLIQAEEILLSESANALHQLKRDYERQLEILSAHEKIGFSQRVLCIAGWLPYDQVEIVRAALMKLTNGRIVVQISYAEKETGFNRPIPVKFPENRWLNPFYDYLKLFGIPRYEEVEPSLFLTFSFLIMFGLMFGDVGQGFCILMLGLTLLLRAKQTYSSLGLFAMMCGGISMLFGFMYGSFFGNEKILRVLWINPMHDISKIFSFSIGMGVILISLSFLINIINRLNERNFEEAVSGKFGISSFLLYLSVLFLLKIGVQQRLVLAVTMIATLLCIFALSRPVLRYLMRQKPIFEHGLATFLITTPIELLEVCTGLLSNTVSFLRLAGFALSHAALGLAIFTLVDIFLPMRLGFLWAFLAIVVGNIFVIVLEGMVVLIQTTRLEVYELFSKFYKGDGVLYEPYKLAN